MKDFHYCHFSLQIEDCFSHDCTPLQSLIKFINYQMSLNFTEDITALTGDISVVLQQMGCNAFSVPAFVGKFQENDKDYKFSADTLVLLNKLKNKYRS